MIYKIEEVGCKECGNKYIANRTHWLCDSCNYKRLHDGKSRSDIQRSKKRKTAVKPRKTGEKELFREIWGEREHICKNCKDILDNEARAHYFAHIKPKSTHPELRLNKDNIMLLCIECHYAHDFQGEEKYKSRTK